MRPRISTVILGIVLLASPASAQQGKTPSQPYEESTAGRAMQRITFGAIDCNGTATCPDDAFTVLGIFGNGTYGNTRANFGGDTTQADVSNSLLQLILSQSQTFPNVSTASGFTFSVGATERPELESLLYGPLFGERALTNGKGALSVTLNAYQLRFRSLNGSQIRNADSGLLWGDTDYDRNQSGYVGICRMDINTTVTYGAVNYGLREQLDVSVAVPIVHTKVTGSNEFLDFTFKNNVLAPNFDVSAGGFAPQGRYYVEGSSTGLGDISLGAKYAFVRKADAGVAVSVRANLPTGSLEDMTGTGEFQAGANFISSFERNGFSPHVNLGFFAATGDIVNEATYNLGLSYTAVENRLTVTGELVGRRLFGLTQFTGPRELGFLVSPETGEQFLVRDFKAETQDINAIFVAFGAKVRLTGQWLASVYTVLPTGVSGLHVTRPTLNFGINFAR